MLRNKLTGIPCDLLWPTSLKKLTLKAMCFWWLYNRFVAQVSDDSGFVRLFVFWFAHFDVIVHDSAAAGGSGGPVRRYLAMRL